MRTLLLLLLGVTLSTSAMAQHIGPGEWIPANPKYVTASGAHCCGLAHCRPPELNEIVRVNGGWIHGPTMTMLSDTDVGVYASEEAQMFICVWGGKLQCAFYVVAG